MSDKYDGKETRFGKSKRGGRRPQSQSRNKGPSVVLETTSSNSQSVSSTFSGIVATLRTLPGATQPPLSSAPPSLSQLSAAMDSLYPTNLEPLTAPVPMYIDPRGYVDLVDEVYQSLIGKKPALAHTLDEFSFRLVSCQLLAKRVLNIGHSLHNRMITGQSDALSQLPDVLELPAPLTMYLEGLGIVRHVTGEIIYPALLLPRIDVPNANLVGVLPSAYATGYFGAHDLNAGLQLIPFGFWRKVLTNLSNGNLWNANNEDAQLEPNANNAQDWMYQRPFLIPGTLQQPGMSAQRLGSLGPLFFTNTPDLTGSLCIEPKLIRDYMLFLERAKEVMSFAPVPRATGGTAAMVAWCEPGNVNNPGQRPSSFQMFTSTVLTSNEQQAARLFRYRQRTDAVFLQLLTLANVSVGGVLTWGMAPPSLNHRTSGFTAIISSSSLLGHFVRFFLK